MTLPIRTLPIVQQWDCHACGLCCHGTIIPLDAEELARLRQQAWQRHPDCQGVRLTERNGLWGGRRLAHRKDGACVFLTSEGRCLIHQEHGEAAKPLICRTFPFQLVPLEDFAYLTLRRYCPSAAADKGRKLEEHLSAVRQLAEQKRPPLVATRPPVVTGRHRRSWQDTLRVVEVIQRLMLDDRYPPVRRLVHALQFCRLLEMCRLHRLASGRLGPLLEMLEISAMKEADESFRTRRRPGRAAANLFRQTAFEYFRLHPKFDAKKSWGERIRLVRSAIAFGLGRGRVPRVHSGCPQSTFESLERPLGHQGIEVLGPLNAYFEIAAASKQYALLGRRHWSIVESFRALAMAYPVAMWMLRLGCGDRPPEFEDVIDVVGMIDRGQGYGPLCGRRHHLRIKAAARRGGLERLAVWYAQ